MKHVPALDGLRGVAILLVLYRHFERTVVPEGPVASALQYGSRLGWSGVDLFFVLSGFLITTILLETKGSETYFRSFYMRRVLRIFPLYYAVLIVALPFSIVWYSHFSPEVVEAAVDSAPWLFLYASNLQMTLAASWSAPPPGFAHFWSLAVEEQFYMIWPAVVLLLSPARLMGVAIAGIVFAPLIRLWFFMGGNPVGAYLFTFARADALLIGALVALIRIYHPRQLPRFAVWAGGLGMLLLAMALIDAPAVNQMYMIRDVSVLGFSGFAMVYAALLIATLQVRALGRMLRARWLRSVGRVSYGMYVIHFILLYWYLVAVPVRPRVGAPGLIGAVVLGSLITYGVALGTWVAIERPFLALKKRFPYGTADKPATVWGDAPGPLEVR